MRAKKVDRKLTYEEKFWLKVVKTDACWNWIGCLNSEGYGLLYADRKNWRAHRYSWYLKYKVDTPYILMHVCDNPRCVNPDHLREGTPSDNVADRVMKNRSAWGERGGSAILTLNAVLDIRERLAKGERQTSIARYYNVDKTTIHKIKSKRNWKNAP